MATKKDLIEAQGYSRRRLLSAFTGGAPGGKELEPAQPLRAVIAGVALSAMLVLGGVFYGLVHPGLPTGWENNRLILASDTGARYVSIKGVLYPVINTASARLLIEAKSFAVITTDQKTLDGIEVGATIGILGAPDALATPASLLNDGWSACEVDAATALAVPVEPLLDPSTGGVVVSVDDDLYVVSGETRFAVDAEKKDSVLRAVGLGSSAPQEVDGGWLNLFDQGAALRPIVVPGAGAAISGSDLRVGTVVHPEGSEASALYLVTERGELAPISALAYQLYLLGSGSELGGSKDVSPSDIAALPTAKDPAGGIDWPLDVVSPMDAAATTCALLTHVDGVAHTVLATLKPDVTLPDDAVGVKVSFGHGALMRVGPTGSGLVYLVDESGTAYAVPKADADLLGRLGYTEKDVADLPAAWLQFMPAGPALTTDAALTSPNSPAAAVSK